MNRWRRVHPPPPPPTPRRVPHVISFFIHGIYFMFCSCNPVRCGVGVLYWFEDSELHTLRFYLRIWKGSADLAPAPSCKPTVMYEFVAAWTAARWILRDNGFECSVGKQLHSWGVNILWGARPLVDVEFGRTCGLHFFVCRLEDRVLLQNQPSRLNNSFVQQPLCLIVVLVPHCLNSSVVRHP